MMDHRIQNTNQYDILLVDDSTDSLKILSRMLKERGYRVRPATNGRHALKSVAARLPDLILLDVKMPVMDGYEVCRRLKSDHHSRNVPVIFISGLGETAKKIEGFKAGGVDYITKPFETEEVLARVAIHLQLHELTEHLEQQVDQRTRQLQREIAERKRTEEVLQESEERYRSIFANAVEGIFQSTPGAKGRFISANPAHARILGYDSAEQMMAEVTEIGPRFWPDPQDRETFSELVARGALTDFEVQLRRRDGRLIWVSFNARPVLDGSGKLDYIEGIMLDITDRKQAEKKLSEHRQILEELVLERTVELEMAKNKAQQYLDIAGVILVAIDADRKVTLINQKGCEVLGCAAGEIIGEDWFRRFVPANNRQVVLEGFQQLMGGEREPVEYFESPVLTQDGRERLVAWHHVILKDSEENVVGTLSSGEDITEKKRAEKQIMRLNRDLQRRAAALEAANKELEGFTYSVSHDLRAPLRHIDGFIELLQKKVPPDEQSRHYMDNVSDAAQKMGRLVDGLLSFARMGRHAMSVQPVALGPLVQDVIRELEPDTAGRNIDWCIGDLPVVSGDAAMLRMVLANLISNALKFTRPRQQVKIEIGSLPGQNSEAVMFVRDNGIGFDMTYADKLFGVFQRLHHADEFEGTGIGLANVHRIIARLGGRTWATGELNQGATFCFAMPSTLQVEQDEFN